MHTLSTLGIVHTVISLAAIPFGVAALVKAGRIDVGSVVGRAYVALAFVGAVTAFGVIKTPQGMGLTVLTLVALATGVAAHAGVFGKVRAAVVETIAMTVSLFFVLLPGATETVTRLPVDAPFAAAPDAPVALAVQGALFAALVAGIVLQLRRTPVLARSIRAGG